MKEVYIENELKESRDMFPDMCFYLKGIYTIKEIIYMKMVL